MTSSWVFAYGSNMDLPDLARWLKQRDLTGLAPDEVRVATLPGHALVWDYRLVARKGGAANCAPADGDLPGVVLRVSPPLLAALDRKEGAAYGRDLLTVRTDDGRVESWVYRVFDERREATPVYPRRAYLEIVLRAARHHRLPQAHLEAIASTPTLD